MGRATRARARPMPVVKAPKLRPRSPSASALAKREWWDQLRWSRAMRARAVTATWVRADSSGEDAEASAAVEIADGGGDAGACASDASGEGGEVTVAIGVAIGKTRVVGPVVLVAGDAGAEDPGGDGEAGAGVEDPGGDGEAGAGVEDPGGDGDLGAVFGAAGGLAIPIFLWGRCASGNTSGPFWPQPDNAPMRLATASSLAIRIASV